MQALRACSAILAVLSVSAIVTAAPGAGTVDRQGDLYRNAGEGQAYRYVQGTDLRKAAHHAGNDGKRRDRSRK